MTYSINLKRILGDLGEQLTAEGEIQMETLTVGDVSFHFRSPVRFDVTFTNTGGGIVANGTAEATVATECSRCLAEFEMPLVGDVEGFYVQPDRVEGLPAEQEFELIEDDKVDVEPAIVAALAVDAPFAPLHAEECKGICSTCGCDLNTAECACEEEPAESPFAVLKEMFGKEGNEGDSK